jgi:curved DNA-binding protein CbpA
MTDTKYFSPEMGIEELRKNFHRFCLELHPDKGGDPEEFKAMKNEYDYFCGISAATEYGHATAANRPPRYTAASERDLREALEKLLNIPKIIIEICGSWLWIYGNTFPVHEQIKAIGCKFSGQKKAWYFSATMRSGKVRGKYNNLQKIRARFGSEVIESTAQEQMQLAA